MKFSIFNKKKAKPIYYFLFQKIKYFYLLMNIIYNYSFYCKVIFLKLPL